MRLQFLAALSNSLLAFNALAGTCPVELTPMRPIVPVGYRDLVRTCICDAHNGGCHWAWVGVRNDGGMDPAALLGAFHDGPIADPLAERRALAATRLLELKVKAAEREAADNAARRAAMSHADAAEKQKIILAAALTEGLPSDATGKASGHWKSTNGPIYRIEDFSDRIRIVNMSNPEITVDARKVRDLVLIDLYVSGKIWQWAMRQRDNDHLSLASLKYSSKDSTDTISRKAAKALAKPQALWIRLY